MPMIMSQTFLNGAHEALIGNTKLARDYANIIKVCEVLAPFTYHGKSKNKTQGHKLKIVQQALSTHFEFGFDLLGYEAEYSVDMGRGYKPRIDFWKEDIVDDTTIAVEVEFGNAASGDRDLIRPSVIMHKAPNAMCHTSHNLIVIILAVRSFASHIDSGMTIYETFSNRARSYEPLFDTPLAIVGLDPSTVPEVDLREATHGDLKVAKGKGKFRDKHLQIMEKIINPRLEQVEFIS